MFPYTFPNLIVAWTFLFFLIQDFFISDTIHTNAIITDLTFIAIFIFIAIRYYKKTPNSLKESAYIISYNISILPLLVINISTLPYFFKSIGSSGLIYLIPMIYSPILFIISFIIVYLVKKYKQKSNKYEETNNLP